MLKPSELPDRLDRIVRIAKVLFKVPVAVINLDKIDQEWDQDIYMSNDPANVDVKAGGYFAGIVIRGEEGKKIAVLTIEDTKPRAFSKEDKQQLIDIGQWLMVEVNTLTLNAALESSRLYAHRLQAMNSMMVDRELKMFALKKEIAALKEASQQSISKGESHA